MLRALHRRWAMAFLAMLAFNCYVELSPGVAQWWSSTGDGGTALPGFLNALLDARPDVANADVHVVLWGMAGVLACLAGRTVRTRGVLLGVAFATGVALELVQALIPGRTAQWLDLLGNVIGLLAAVTTCAVIRHLTLRRAHT